MRRFNIDEFIWFLTLVLFTWIMIYFVVSGRVVYFININMINYFYGAICILILFSVFQIRNIFTPRVRTDISNKFLPLIFTIFICIIFLYVMPIMKGYKGNDITDNNISRDSNILSISNDNFEILNQIEFEEEFYDGKKIYMIGFIERDMSLNDNEGYLCREIISCCQKDKTKIRVKIKGLDNGYKDGGWIKVLGTINFNDGWYVDTLALEVMDEPYDIFYHENL